MMHVLKKIRIIVGLCLISVAINAYGDDTTDEEESAAKVNADTTDKIGNMLLQAIALIGIPYKFGGNTPDSGLDCSGFIRYVYKKALGITLPRTAADMATLGSKVALEELAAGDLIFFNTQGGRRISHMGMYLGNNKFIHAPRTGKNIEITEFNHYYQGKFIVAKRIAQADISSNGSHTLKNVSAKKLTQKKKVLKIKKHRTIKLPVKKGAPLRRHNPAVLR